MTKNILAGIVAISALAFGAPAVMAQSTTDSNLLNLSPNEAAALSNAQQGITQVEANEVDNRSDSDSRNYTYVAPNMPSINRDAYTFSTEVDGIRMSATCPTGGIGFQVGSYLGGLGVQIPNNELPDACAAAQEDQLDIVYLRVGLNSAQRLGDAEVKSLDTLVYTAAGERWGATPQELSATVAMERTVTAASPEVTEANIAAEEARLEELLTQ